MTALWWLVLLGVVTAAVWAAYRRPPQVSLTRSVPPAGFTGGRVPLHVTLRLRSHLPMRVVWEDELPLSLIPEAPLAGKLLLLGDRSSELSTNLTLKKRGVYSWPGATVRWADPLGLFWRSLKVSPDTRLEVYPGTHGLTLPDLLRPLLSEGTLTRSLGLEDAISLRGAREYVYGDPPGRVHWKLSARTDTLMVRELERMAASSLTVFVDVFGNSDVYVESAVRLAASLIREAGELELPVAVATTGQQSPTGRGEASLHAALQVLARIQPNTLPPVIPPTRAGGNLIIITGRAGADLIRQAMYARAQASRVSIIALPEGFYLEPGENPRRQWGGLPDAVRELERMSGVLAGSGILVYVLRGNQSVLQIAP
ncbi:DUF58 domain-containing protein [Deinococcus fonticola]|uniref:DUF58 domain-containing protein n=1 Tax=Deinococcus fonticola TaxID=2528713 RepID=UPI001F109E8C|nr:DUF58 domain-containing protein [Deinococcus fonticola]